MADCGEKCGCADCCVTPVTYTNNRFAPGIVLASPAAFPPPGSTGDYANDVAAKRPYLPIDRFAANELDSALDAIEDSVLPLAATTTLDGATSTAGRLKYPNLADKVSTTPINRVEVANFIFDYNLTPLAVGIMAASDPSKLASMLNNFFRGAMAGFSLCAFLSAPFGIIALVEDLKNLAVNLLDDAKALINDVVTKAKSIVEDIKKFVEKAKEFVDDLASSIKEKLTNLAEGFKSRIDELVNEGFKFGPAFKAIAQKMASLVDKVETFFSAENMEEMKQNIEDAIVNAAKGFGQLTVDIIDQLLYIFCGITTDLEKSANDKINEVEAFALNIEEEISGLVKSSNFATAPAVAAGRPTPTPESLANQCASYANAINGAPPGTYPSLVYTPQFTSLPAPSAWSNLSFADHVLNHPTLRGPKKVYMYDYPELAQGEDDHAPFVLLPQPAHPPDSGYRGMKLECLEKANACAKLLKRTFHITSAFRSKIHQQQIRNEQGGRHIGGGRRNLSRYPPGCKIPNVALKSLHSKGDALDITMSSLGDISEARKHMLAHGFAGQGLYTSNKPGGGFMHFDLGPRRSWGS